MNELLRKKDVVEAVGVAKSTVSDWINEFHMYIPTVKDGQTTYYKREAIDVLLAIKEMRDKGVPKIEISKRLAERFPVNAEDTPSPAKSEKTDGRTDTALAIASMASMLGKVVEQLERQAAQLQRQDERIRQLEEHNRQLMEKFDAQNRYINELIEKLDAQQRYINELNEKRDRQLMDAVRESLEVRRQLAASQEEAKKQKRGLIRRLFGK
jgi:DNA-binding transcriptional MerR regulator